MASRKAARKRKGDKVSVMLQDKYGTAISNDLIQKTNGKANETRQKQKQNRTPLRGDAARLCRALPGASAAPKRASALALTPS